MDENIKYELEQAEKLEAVTNSENIENGKKQLEVWYLVCLVVDI